MAEVDVCSERKGQAVRRFSSQASSLALRFASEAIIEQRDALRHVRDRCLAVLGATTAASTFLVSTIGVPGANPPRGADWAPLLAGLLALAALLLCTVQVLRPRTVRGNMSASTILSWADTCEPDAELAMHLDEDREKNADMLATVHRWFLGAVLSSAAAVPSWAMVSIAWRT